MTTAAPAPQVLVVTSAGAVASTMVPVLAALEAAGMRVRAIDVGHAGGGGAGITDRVRRALLGESAERRLRREVDGNPPDVAVAFDPHAALALTVARDQSANPAPVIAVIAEHDPSVDWRQTDADRFLVVDELAAVALAEAGVEAERILVIGPIGEHAWSKAGRHDRAAVRTRLGLTGKTVLVEVSGVGAEAAAQLTMQLSLVERVDEITFLFDAAGDVDVASVLRRQVPTLGLRAKLFGSTSDAAMLWRAADVVVVRPSPASIARALLCGARLVAWVDEELVAGAKLAAALEHRKQAVAVKNSMLLSGAIETALAATWPSVPPDGADNVADVAAVVAADRRGVVEERQAAARSATREKIRAVGAAADHIERTTAMPGELEDLSAPHIAAVVPDSGELDRLQSETADRIRELTRGLASARSAMDDASNEARSAMARGDESAASAANRRADAERARQHALLGELAALETEAAAISRARTFASKAAAEEARRPQAASARSTSKPAESIDDALAAMKRNAGSGPAQAAPPKSQPTAKAAPRSQPAPAVDDELAALKRKMANAPAKKK